jgi:TolA-binding protein
MQILRLEYLKKFRRSSGRWVNKNGIRCWGDMSSKDQDLLARIEKLEGEISRLSRIERLESELREIRLELEDILSRIEELERR